MARPLAERTIHIYDGDDLNGEAASSAPPTDVLDLSAATATLCLANTGANPVRPHMLEFNSSHSHAVLTFVASGHVVIFNAATRAPVACVRTSAGAGGARQAHAASPAPDDSYILVANQNGKLLERINANFATDTFTLDSLATINLATCTTPNGLACEDALREARQRADCPGRRFEQHSGIHHAAWRRIVRGQPPSDADADYCRV